MLEINYSLIWTFVNVIVLYFLLRRFLYQPVMRIIQERQKGIDDQLDHAQRTHKEAEQALEQSKKILQDSHDRAGEDAKQILHSAHLQEDQIITQAKESAREIMTQAKKKADLETERMMRENKEKMVDIAIRAAQKVTKDKIASQTERDLFEDLIKNAGDKNAQ